MLTGVTSFGCALHRLIHKSFVTTTHRAGNGRDFNFLVAGPWHDHMLTALCPSVICNDAPAAGASLQMTGEHNLFRLYALAICDHCPQPREMWTLLLRLQFPIVNTTLWGQLAGKTLTVLPSSLLLYSPAMVAFVYQTPTFPPHYGDNVKVNLQHICQAIPVLLRGFSSYK